MAGKFTKSPAGRSFGYPKVYNNGMSEGENNLSTQELINQTYLLNRRYRSKNLNHGIVSVGSGEYRIGKSTEVVGSEFPLSDFLIKKELNIMTDEKERYPIDRVFFRTETGNIYSIRKNNGGEIVSAREGEKSTVSILNVLVPTKNEPLVIRVGESFNYSIQPEKDIRRYLPCHTSRVVEIVTVSGKIQKSDTEIHNMGKGKETSIVSDFRELMKESKNK